jgi:hypothetical protein
MKESKAPLITDYIVEFAKKSSFEFSWAYPDLFHKSTLSTIFYLRSLNKFTTSYLSVLEKTLSGNANFIMLLSLRFVRKVYESNLTVPILSNPDPTESVILLNIFTEVFESLLSDMGKSLGKEAESKIRKSSSLITRGLAVYCWQYLKNTKERGLLLKIVEELYLLREIEVFKNRKGE